MHVKLVQMVAQNCRIKTKCFQQVQITHNKFKTLTAENSNHSQLPKKKNEYFLNVCLLQHAKSQVELFEMHWFSMFSTALCAIFLIKLRWPKNKSFYDTLFSSV